MKRKNEMVSITTGVVIDEEFGLSLVELCRRFAVQRDWIVALVEEGILDPAGPAPNEWQFSGESCWRVSVVLRLERDLDVNLSGAAVVLDLLEEVEKLRQRLGS